MSDSFICPECKDEEYKTQEDWFNHVKNIHPAVYLSLMFEAAEDLKEKLQDD